MNLPDLTVVRKSRSAVLTSFEMVIAWKELISEKVKNDQDLQCLYNAALSQVKLMENYMKSISDRHVYETKAVLMVGRYAFTVHVMHQVPNYVSEFAVEASAAIAELYQKFISNGHPHEDIGPSITFDIDLIRKMIEHNGTENKWKETYAYFLRKTS